MTVLFTVSKLATLGTLGIEELAFLLLLEKAALVLRTASAVASVRLAICPLLQRHVTAWKPLLSYQCNLSQI